MTLPASYSWLMSEPAPRMLVEALKLHGTVETPGRADNPIILGWAAELGLERVFTADSIPWCGLFMALVAKRADKPLPPKPLWALNWARWGEDGGQPELGDVLVFIRTYRDRGGHLKTGGHVGLYVGEDPSCYHVLGGNQSDAVTIAPIAKGRLRACRAYYAVGKPASARPIVLAATGAVSTDEG
jgi:uncharacterized protein (TIGR02594 family)